MSLQSAAKPPHSRSGPSPDADAAGLIELIGAIWRSYPGIVFDVDAELPELHALATAFARAGGAGWVAERRGRIVGCVGMAPPAPPATGKS